VKVADQEEVGGAKEKDSVIASLKPMLRLLATLNPKTAGFLPLLEGIETRIDAGEKVDPLPEFMKAVSMLYSAVSPSGKAQTRQPANGAGDCSCDPGPGPRKTYVAKNHEEGDRPVRAVRKPTYREVELPNSKPLIQIIIGGWSFLIERTGKDRYLVSYRQHLIIHKRAHSGKEIEKLLKTISKASEHNIHISHHWRNDVLESRSLEQAPVKTIKHTVRYFLAFI
jgi:hypothetical protein